MNRETESSKPKREGHQPSRAAACAFAAPSGSSASSRGRWAKRSERLRESQRLSRARASATASGSASESSFHAPVHVRQLKRNSCAVFIAQVRPVWSSRSAVTTGASSARIARRSPSMNAPVPSASRCSAGASASPRPSPISLARARARLTRDAGRPWRIAP